VDRPSRCCTENYDRNSKRRLGNARMVQQNVGARSCTLAEFRPSQTPCLPSLLGVRPTHQAQVHSECTCRLGARGREPRRTNTVWGADRIPPIIRFVSCVLCGGKITGRVNAGMTSQRTECECVVPQKSSVGMGDVRILRHIAHTCKPRHPPRDTTYTIRHQSVEFPPCTSCPL
jgi:hypothetical protein